MAGRSLRVRDAVARIVIVTGYQGEAGACGYALKQDILGLAELIQSIVGAEQ